MLHFCNDVLVSDFVLSEHTDTIVVTDQPNKPSNIYIRFYIKKNGLNSIASRLSNYISITFVSVLKMICLCSKQSMHGYEETIVFESFSNYSTLYLIILV